MLSLFNLLLENENFLVIMLLALVPPPPKWTSFVQKSKYPKGCSIFINAMKPQRKDFFFVNAIFNVILMIIINKYICAVCVCGRL